MPRADSPKDASARRRSGRIPKPPPTRRPATLSSSHPSKDPTNSTSYSVAQAAARDKDRDPNTGGPNETILWKHPAELEFIYPDDYSQSDIISFLIQNAFSIPPPPPTTGKSGSAAPSTPGAPTTPGGSNDAPSSMEDFTVITAVDGTPTILPLGYRTPLMFAAKYLWDSVRLVLTSVDPPPETEWEAYKYDILNLSRLCSAFLAEARNAMKARRGKGMSKRWRSQMFDRVLTRYHWGWLVNREEYIRAFWNEFREDEYEKDVLRRDWHERALKGHNGFHLTEEEINEGITAERFQSGLSLVNGRYIWDVEAYVRSNSLAIVESNQNNTNSTSNDTNGNANGHDSGADASAFDASGDHPRRRHGLSSPMRNIKKELIEPSSPFGGMRRADFSHSISPLSPNVSEDEAAGDVGKDATEGEDEDIASSNDESRRRQRKKGKKKAKELDRQDYSYPRHARRGRVRTARRGLNFVRGSTGSGRRGWGRWGRNDSSEQESSEDESSGSGSDISSASRRKTTPSTSTSSASPSARGGAEMKALSEANMAKEEREEREKQEREKQESEKQEREKQEREKQEKESEKQEENENEKQEKKENGEQEKKENEEQEKKENEEQENERQERGNAERAALVNGSGVEAMVVDVPAPPPLAAQAPPASIPASAATLTRAPTPTSAQASIIAPTPTASVPTPASLAAATPTPAGEEERSLKRRRESSTSGDRPAKRPERDSFPPISHPPTSSHRDPEGAAVMAALTAVADAINARNVNGASGVPMVTNSSPIVGSALAAAMHGAVLSSSTQKTDTLSVPPTPRALAEAVIGIVKGPNGSTFLANVTAAAAAAASKALSPILGANAASPVLMDGTPASATNGTLMNGSVKVASGTTAKTTPQPLTPILTNASTPALAIPNTALPKSILGGTPAIQRINSNDRPNSRVNGQGSMSPSELGSFPARTKEKTSFFGFTEEKSAPQEVEVGVAGSVAGVNSGVTGENGSMNGVENGASRSQREGDMEEVHGVGAEEGFERQPTHESRIRSPSPVHNPNSRARDDESPLEDIGRLLSSSDDDQETCDLLVNGGADVDMDDATGSDEEKKVIGQPVVLQSQASIVPPKEMLPPPNQPSVPKQTQHYQPPQNQHSAQPQVQQSQQPLSDLLLGGSINGRDDMLQKVVSVVPGMLASLQALLETATGGAVSRGVSMDVGVCAGGSSEGGKMKGKEKEVRSVGRVERGVMVNSAFSGPSSFDPQRSSLNDVARPARSGQIDPLLVSMLLERIDSLELEMQNERGERRSMQADIGDLQANEEDLRQQNILLHQQNANLRQHTTELRQQNASLRQEVSGLKHDIGDLRRQLMSAPTMTPTSSVAVAGGHATNHNHNHDHVPTRPSSSASNAVRPSGIPLSSLFDVEQLRASNLHETRNNTTTAPLVHLLALDLESIRSHAGPAKDVPSPAPKDDAPATPAPSEGNPYVRRSMSQSDLIEEGLPLPIKSQRKHHMMTFPRSPMSMEE